VRNRVRTLALSDISSILCIGAHSDDLEIGCGGTLLSLIGAQPKAHVHWVVFGGLGARGAEARASAEELLKGVASTIELHEFRDAYLPYDGGRVKDAFEDLKRRIAPPSLVLTHTGDDMHQDHRLVNELTWNTFRNSLILEFEIPKWDGDLGRPNVYVPLTVDVVERKLAHLDRHFGSQREKDWYDQELFRSVLRLRGMETRAPEGYAEAFMGRKVGLSFGAAG
jgi:LmbE family N-acetylglucosaminyl deacetylase